ncbi:DUF1127 domain-containing protein [Paracoccus pacificus]|uniref:DUF1127 domain-containing protein n=1 Tax=Paracoccus pacificus TaxID=1463598 RepID=A0ABW4R8T4_9RHOB
MTAIDINRAATGARGNGFAGKLVAMLNEWNDARVTRKSLSRLSDRELDDIGLCRGDIERIARRG